MTDTPIAPTKTKGQEAAQDVAALLRARNPVLWVVTKEEQRVERYLIEAAGAAGYVPRTWDCVQGVLNASGTPANIGSSEADGILDFIGARARNTTERGVWILRDLTSWIDGPIGITTRRRLRNLARALPGTPRDKAQAIIVLTPSAEVPIELAGNVSVVEWPLPDRTEVAAILDAAIESLPEFEIGSDGKPDESKPLRSKAAPNGQRDKAIDSAIGLTSDEAASCYARSLVTLRRIEPGIVAKEKKRVVAKERVIEWYDPIVGGLDAVGGLHNLKSWLQKRQKAYSKEARAYGLPTPKGIVLVGQSGCGKSLSAKACAGTWNVPLLKLDLGALKDKFVGGSEAKLRTAFRVIESVGPCVVWLDEAEKSFAGATQGAADGGVSSDALGAFLNWMQERAGQAFVVATANDISTLPPELLRKGRFDELFFVDLPTFDERQEILKAALIANGLKNTGARINPAAVASVTKDFTGAEIASLVPTALFEGFDDGLREITTDDLIEAARDVVPLSVTAKEKVEALREWAKTRARPAGRAQAEAPIGQGRVLDI